MDDFEFDETLDEKALADMDKDFLKGIEAKTVEVETDDTNNAFTFWFLIIILLLFIFFLVIGVAMVVKGRQRRFEYQSVGYR